MGTHHGDTVGEVRRLLDVVGDKENRLVRLLADVHQVFLENLAGLVVERPEWLVHQQNLGVVGQRPRDGDALFHPAGEFLRILLLVTVQADASDELLGRRFDLLGAVVRRVFQSEGDVLEDTHPVVQRVLLKDDAPVGAWPIDWLAVDFDDTLGWVDETADDVQQRTLATAARADDGDELAGTDVH